MYVMKHFISILTYFMTSHKITFYSIFYDMDLLEICTHDRTDISLYVSGFWLSLHQHRFFDKKPHAVAAFDYTINMPELRH